MKSSRQYNVEQAIEIGDDEKLDYSIYPGFNASIGFTQRGCRLKCGFCVVQKRQPRATNTIASIGAATHILATFTARQDSQPREQKPA